MIFNCAQFILQCFIKFPDFTEFTKFLIHLRKTPLSTMTSVQRLCTSPTYTLSLSYKCIGFGIRCYDHGAWIIWLLTTQKGRHANGTRKQWEWDQCLHHKSQLMIPLLLLQHCFQLPGGHGVYSMVTSWVNNIHTDHSLDEHLLKKRIQTMLDVSKYLSSALCCLNVLYLLIK